MLASALPLQERRQKKKRSQSSRTVNVCCVNVYTHGRAASARHSGCIVVTFCSELKIFSLLNRCQRSSSSIIYWHFKSGSFSVAFVTTSSIQNVFGGALIFRRTFFEFIMSKLFNLSSTKIRVFFLPSFATHEVAIQSGLTCNQNKTHGIFERYKPTNYLI